MATGETIASFATYGLQDGRAGLYAIGAHGAGEPGVIQKMAQAFNYALPLHEPTVEAMSGLIGTVAPDKELRNNLAAVQSALGTKESGIEIARGWVLDSGILTPVWRSYTTAEAPQDGYDSAVVLPGVARWIDRRVRLVRRLQESGHITRVLLAGGTRQMKATEGSESRPVREGMTEAEYMEQVILPELLDLNLDAEVVAVRSTKGDDVAFAAAQRVADFVKPSGRIVIPSNAGVWPQVGGQMRSAMRSDAVHGSRYDALGQQIDIVSDTIPLGETGDEPPTTHQHPLTAVGLLPRDVLAYLQQYLF